MASSELEKSNGARCHWAVGKQNADIMAESIPLEDLQTNNIE
ncbi:hypothetical protein [Flavivirga aquatica]|nr:hypothetical protein [Flavivirga aquatica]